MPLDGASEMVLDEADAVVVMGRTGCCKRSSARRAPTGRVAERVVVDAAGDGPMQSIQEAAEEPVRGEAMTLLAAIVST